MRKRVCRFYGMIAALYLTLPAGPLLPAEIDRNVDRHVEAALDRAIAARKIPAMAVTVIRNGAARPEVVRGVRTVGRPDPAKRGERWLLGSDTKAMTATLIGRLVDRGKLKWTARLDEMLPDYAADMRPEYRDVTLIELLSHFSGLPGDLSDEAYILARGKDPRPVAVQRLDYIRKGLSDPPEAAPRTKHIYSNTGFIIAAVIAERAGGKPYEQLMEELVFRPLRIRSATFSQPGSGELTGHVDGRPARLEDGNPSVFNSSGGVRMTMPDWAKFCIDQLRGAKGRHGLLKPETYQILQTAYAPIGEIGPGNPHYGLGWEVAPGVMRRMGPVLSHSGSDGNWIADVWLFPGSGNGLLIATNAAYSMSADKAITDVFRELVVDLAPPRTDGVKP